MTNHDAEIALSLAQERLNREDNQNILDTYSLCVVEGLFETLKPEHKGKTCDAIARLMVERNMGL